MTDLNIPVIDLAKFVNKDYDELLKMSWDEYNALALVKKRMQAANK